MPNKRTPSDNPQAKALRPPGSKHFVAGNPGGPGRQKGQVSGRKQVVNLLDAILTDPQVKAKIAEAMVNQIMSGDKNALKFLQDHVYPNTPKEVSVTDDRSQQGRVAVRIIMGDEGADKRADGQEAGAPPTGDQT
jgi:hypothetical protein